MTSPTRSVGLIPLLLLAFQVAGCRQGTGLESSAASEPQVEEGDFERELLLTGELTAVHSHAIKAPETSIFQMRIQVMAEEGLTVAKGDPVLSFDNSGVASRLLDLEQQILDAETRIIAKRNEVALSLKDLEIELARAEHAHAVAALQADIEEGVLSRKVHSERALVLASAVERLEEVRSRRKETKERGKADLDLLKVARDKLEKDLRSTERDVGLLAIAAPADGLVVYEKRQGSTARFQEGDSCWPGQTVIRLPDLSQMQALFHVNEVDVRHLKVGMNVRVTLDAFPDRELEGVIKLIPSMAVKRSSTSRIAVFEVTCTLSATWEGVMKPGMSVLGRLIIERLEGVPLLARSAVRFDGETYWLRQQGAGDEATVVPVKPLARNATHYLLARDQLAELKAALGQLEAGS